MLLWAKLPPEAFELNASLFATDPDIVQLASAWADTATLILLVAATELLPVTAVKL
jgi:hypothetical protein